MSVVETYIAGGARGCTGGVVVHGRVEAIAAHNEMHMAGRNARGHNGVEALVEEPTITLDNEGTAGWCSQRGDQANENRLHSVLRKEAKEMSTKDRGKDRMRVQKSDSRVAEKNEPRWAADQTHNEAFIKLPSGPYQPGRGADTASHPCPTGLLSPHASTSGPGSGAARSERESQRDSRERASSAAARRWKRHYGEDMNSPRVLVKHMSAPARGACFLTNAAVVARAWQHYHGWEIAARLPIKGLSSVYPLSMGPAWKPR